MPQANETRGPLPLPLHPRRVLLRIAVLVDLGFTACGSVNQRLNQRPGHRRWGSTVLALGDHRYW
ncbi:hypothetical protein FFLO_03298 [Filobasidium floriforme]|uniref:Uncharacterized protein n=1 Tax=Filobasidium floriforme TaxID=5210 RepID=A0A8K0JL14_9TREE|nr:hypothetical protein FFLO_03298 [Filobasidium floriforme]